MAFEVFYRKGKLLLMLQSVKRAHAIDPNNPQLHDCLVRFAFKVSSTNNVKSAMSVVLQQELKKLLGDNTIQKFNAEFSKKNSSSLLHRLAVAKGMYLMDSSTGVEALKLVTDLPDCLTDRTLENCTNVLDTLLDGTFGECEEVTQDYVNKCHKLFSLARVFTAQEDLQQKMNGEENALQREVDPICDDEI